ncbi:hypothetical protein HYW35_02600 [Candidatus Saccharibacteria bacterium]|nr:hypothetical protein [Candidatus Saccharibacteria bacterium]
MSGHQERRSDGWERRQASVLRCHLGTLATAAALAVGLIGAPGASSAESQTGRAGNVVPIGGANTRDEPTSANHLLVQVNKARNAYLGGIVRLKLLVSSDDDKSLSGGLVLITPAVGNPAEIIFVKGPVAETPGKVYVSQDSSTLVDWYFKAPAISERPATLSTQVGIPKGFKEGKFCLDILALASDVEEPTDLTACWNIIRAPEKLQKQK